MKKRIMAAIGGAALGLTILAAPADARPTPRNDGAYCVQQGIGTLKSLGLLQAAAKQQVNYALLDVDGPGIPGLGVPGGLIRTQLGSEFTAPLGQIVKLHTTNPELFAWCDR
jgi:hypothetical protein